MKIITNNPIQVEKSSNASGADEKLAAAKAKQKSNGIFSQGAKADRKEARTEAKAERIEKRVEKRLARRAKYGARPLKQVGGFFKDELATIKKTGSGYVKTNADGSETPVDTANIAKVGNILVDKADAGGKPLVAEAGKAIVNYTKSETVDATAPDGSIQTYKATDTEADDGAPAKKPMDPKLKWGLIIGGVAVAVLIAWKLKKK
jgi:hypothetical protein